MDEELFSSFTNNYICHTDGPIISRTILEPCIFAPCRQFTQEIS